MCDLRRADLLLSITYNQIARQGESRTSCRSGISRIADEQFTMDAEWVEVRSCSSLHEAAFSKSVLEAAEIESMIPTSTPLVSSRWWRTCSAGSECSCGARTWRARAVLDDGDRTAQR